MWKNKVIKKVIKIAATIALVGSMTAITVSASEAPPANATRGNTQDEPYQFVCYFDRNSDDQFYYTEPRDKLDATSSYMKCRWMGYAGSGTPIRTFTYKAHVNMVTGYEDAYVGAGPTYTFAEGNAKYMTNNVYESGARRAAIMILATNNIDYPRPFDITVDTVWSPDSV